MNGFWARCGAEGTLSDASRRRNLDGMVVPSHVFLVQFEEEFEDSPAELDENVPDLGAPLTLAMLRMKSWLHHMSI